MSRTIKRIGTYKNGEKQELPQMYIFKLNRGKLLEELFPDLDEVNSSYYYREISLEGELVSEWSLRPQYYANRRGVGGALINLTSENKIIYFAKTAIGGNGNSGIVLEVDPTALKKSGLTSNKIITSTPNTSTTGEVSISTVSKTDLETQLISNYTNPLNLDSRITLAESSIISGLKYSGVLNASTGTIPTSLPASNNTNKGNLFVVNIAGTNLTIPQLGGGQITDLQVGDQIWVVGDGTYVKIDNTEAFQTAIQTPYALNNTLAVTNVEEAIRKLETILNKNKRKLEIGWYRDTMALFLSDQSALGINFVTTNVYENAFYYTTAKFDSDLRPWLNIKKHINYFFEFRGQTPNTTAQLASVLTGSYDNIINLLCDDIIAYNTALLNKEDAREVRLLIFHEINIGAYEYGLTYNRSANNWSASAVNGAFGVNNKADFIPAVQRIKALINAKEALITDPRIKGKIKLCLTFNFQYSNIETIKELLPPAGTVDYYGIDIYSRFGLPAQSGPAFFNANLLYMLTSGLNRVYEELTENSNLPILITEAGSSANTTKYHRSEWFIQAYKDIKNYLPRIVEFNYFDNASGDWAFTPKDKLRIKELLYNHDFDSVIEDDKVLKPNIISKDLTQITNWIVGGTNAGVATITTNTGPTGTGSDEARKGSHTLELTLPTTGTGTNNLSSHVGWTETSSTFDDNITHTLTFQAYADVDDVNMAVGCINNANIINSELRGYHHFKLGREAKTYQVGIVSGTLSASGVIRTLFAFGKNTAGGKVYISIPSLKLERGEGKTLNIPATPVVVPQVEVLGTRVANLNITATASELSLYDLIANSDTGTDTIAINRLKVGSVISIKLIGHYTTSATSVPTLTIKLKIGAVTLCTIPNIILPASQTTKYIDAEFTLTPRTVGNSGVITASGFVRVATADAEVTKLIPVVMTGSLTVGTDVALLIDVTGQFSLATVGNNIQIRQQITKIEQV